MHWVTWVPLPAVFSFSWGPQSATFCLTSLPTVRSPAWLLPPPPPPLSLMSCPKASELWQIGIPLCSVIGWGAELRGCEKFKAAPVDDWRSHLLWGYTLYCANFVQEAQSSNQSFPYVDMSNKIMSPFFCCCLVLSPSYSLLISPIRLMMAFLGLSECRFLEFTLICANFFHLLCYYLWKYVALQAYALRCFHSLSWLECSCRLAGERSGWSGGVQGAKVHQYTTQHPSQSRGR